MGASGSKSREASGHRITNLNSEQIGKAKLQFRRASQGADHLNSKQFAAFAEPFLSSSMRDSVFGKIGQPHNKVVESVFVQFADRMLGHTGELAGCLFSIHGSIDRFITDLAESVFLCEDRRSTKDVEQLMEFLRRSAPSPDTEESFSRWLRSSPCVVQFAERVYTRLLLGANNSLLPKFVGAKHSLLSTAELFLVNFNLPNEFRHKWELLFSSAQHGTSFSKMCSLVNGMGPCLLCIESEDGRVFGGFASAGFVAGPTYTGNGCCFLFQGGDEMAVFAATGFNDNYAYLNYNQMTLPNGMGIGGRDTYWSVFIREEDNIGICGASVSTFEKCHIAGKNEFRPKNIEIWRTGEKPDLKKYDENGEEIKERSVMDKDPGAKAILELAGKKLHSEAFREPHPEDD